MTPDFTIRWATPRDVETLVKLIFELAVYERAEDQCFATPEKLHEQLFGQRPHAECIVAVVDENVVGMAIFFHNFSTWEAAPGLYLEDLYVRQTYRKFGIGKALLERLAHIAVERNCIRFEWSVLDWNKPARDFYEKLGAKPQLEWVTYRTEGEALQKLASSSEEFQKKSAPEEPKDDSSPINGNGQRITIYTDGGSDPNPGVGAWSAVIRVGQTVYERTGGQLGTTNNRMEMSAAIEALKAIAPNQQVTLLTDSQYLKNGITTWIHNWKKNNWRRGKKADSPPVKNVDLWLELEEQCKSHHVTWDWVKGHAGNTDNERADELCTEKIALIKANSTAQQRKDALAKMEEAQAENERKALGDSSFF